MLGHRAGKHTNMRWLGCRTLANRHVLFCRCDPVIQRAVNRQKAQTHTQSDRCPYKPLIGICTLWTNVCSNTHTNTPVHLCLWCLRSQWAAQTCGSSWWTPRDRLPGSGSCRSATCCFPAESCWTDRVPCPPCSPRCVWRQWWSHDLWWPLCSQASWSSGGFPPGSRQDLKSIQSSWEDEWKSPEACLPGEKKAMWLQLCSTTFEYWAKLLFQNLEEWRGGKWWKGKQGSYRRKKGRRKTGGDQEEGNWFKIKKGMLSSGCAGGCLQLESIQPGKIYIF